MTRPAGLGGLALAVLMLASTAWAHAPGTSLAQFAQFGAAAGVGILLLIAFPACADRRRLPWWAIAMAAAAVIITIDLWTGLAFRRITSGDAMSYRYNRGLVTLVLMAWPLLALIAHRRQWPWAVALVPVVASVFLAGESQTAMLGLLIGALVLPLAIAAPRFVRWAGIAAVVAVFATGPLMGTLASRAIGASSGSAIKEAHADDRVNIWLSFEAAVQRRPFLGSGFGSSLNLDKAPVAREVPSERRTLLAASHPHNAFLQVWVELGAAGAVLAAGLLVSLLGWAGRLPALLQPYVLTWFASAAGMALVSHGAWQAWWWAVIAASFAGFLAIRNEIEQDQGSVKPLQ